MAIAGLELNALSVFVALVGTAVCYVYLFWRYPGRTEGLLKSPPGIPVLGHIEYLNPAALVPSLQKLAREIGPAIELYLFRTRFVILCDEASIKEVLLHRPKIFRRDKGIDVAFALLGLSEHSLFSAEGSTWSRLRKLLATPFNKQNVSRMSEAVQTEVLSMLDSLAAAPGGSFSDVNEPMMHFTVRVVLRVAFNNVEVEDYFSGNQLMEDAGVVFELFTQRTLFPLPAWVWNLWPPAIHWAGLEVNRRMDEVVGRIVDSEKQKMDDSAGASCAHGTKSFIQLLLSESAEGGKLSPKEVVANIKTMILAGSETTSVSLSWALYFLSLDKRFFDKAREEADTVLVESNGALEDASIALPFCAACFKEVTRFKGPAPMLGAALVSNDKTFLLANGVEIRPNDTVLLTTEYLMTDPDVFTDPYEFNPMRWLTSSNAQLEKMNSVFFSFGYGSRLCPGIHLAKLEGELALAHIVKNFDLKLECAPDEIRRILRFTVKAEKIPMKFIKRFKQAKI